MSTLFTCAVLLIIDEKWTTGTRRDTHHGHYTGHSSAGTSRRPRTANKGARLRRQRPTTVLRIRNKSTAPETRIARAPELVTAIIVTERSTFTMKVLYRSARHSCYSLIFIFLLLVLTLTHDLRLTQAAAQPQAGRTPSHNQALAKSS